MTNPRKPHLNLFSDDEIILANDYKKQKTQSVKYATRRECQPMEPLIPTVYELDDLIYDRPSLPGSLDPYSVLKLLHDSEARDSGNTRGSSSTRGTSSGRGSGSVMGSTRGSAETTSGEIELL